METLFLSLYLILATLRNDLFKILIGVVLGIFICSQFKSCNKEPEIETVIKTVHHTDTVTVYETDTVYVKGDTKYIYLDKPSVEINDDSTNTYTNEIDEEDLTATIVTTTKGEMLDQSIEYNVISPVITNTETITVTNTDTVFITNNVLKPDKMKFYLGTGVGLYDKGIIGADFNATIQTKNSYQYTYGYEVSFDKSLMPDYHKVGVKIPIKFNSR